MSMEIFADLQKVFMLPKPLETGAKTAMCGQLKKGCNYTGGLDNVNCGWLYFCMLYDRSNQGKCAGSPILGNPIHNIPF